MSKLLSFVCASLISLLICPYSFGQEFDQGNGLSQPDGGNSPGSDRIIWGPSNGFADAGQFGNTTQKTWENNGQNQVQHIDNGWVYDVSAQQGETQDTQTHNYQKMLDTEVSTDLLSTGSVSLKKVPSASFNLGFKGKGGSSFGGPWFGTVPPACSTTSVDLSITDTGY
jgi:hypothetical protein